MFHRIKKHKHRAQHGATIIIIISNHYRYYYRYYRTIAYHCTTMTANFVEISNALEPT